MGEPDLTVDFDFLRDCERKLGQLKKTFEDIENRRDDMKEHWGSGSGSVAGAMEDFVDNWDDYRTRLIESIESVGKHWHTQPGIPDVVLRGHHDDPEVIAAAMEALDDFPRTLRLPGTD